MVNNIVDFRKQIASILVPMLEMDGFRYIKTKELFRSTKENGVDKIVIYPTAYRGKYLSIDIRCYYDSNDVKEIFKEANLDFKQPRLKIGTIGGSLNFIVRKEFNQIWDFPYSHLVFDLPNSFDVFLNSFIELYHHYIVHFFDRCRDPKYLHLLLNENGAHSVGFGINYENKVLKGLPVAIRAGCSFRELLELSKEYENALESDSSDYLRDYLKVKQALCEKI